MRVRHPDNDAYVSILGEEKVPVAEDGTFVVPDGRAEAFLSTWCGRNGYDREDVVVDADAGDEDDAEADAEDADEDAPAPGDRVCTCDVGEACDKCGGDCPTVKTDGEVCGRELPCPYHSSASDSEADT